MPEDDNFSSPWGILIASLVLIGFIGSFFSQMSEPKEPGEDAKAETVLTCTTMAGESVLTDGHSTMVKLDHITSAKINRHNLLVFVDEHSTLFEIPKDQEIILPDFFDACAQQAAAAAG